LAFAKTKGVRGILLNVSAPFHSPLMAKAGEAMAAALAEVAIRPPAVALYANVTAAPTLIPAEIRRLLVEQVTGRVRWRESIAAMHQAGIGRFVEIGAGKVLAGMVKRIAPEAEAISLNEPADLEAFAKGV
jgi:[acyl-carrier-protein] S-malonyltransferase